MMAGWGGALHDAAGERRDFCAVSVPSSRCWWAGGVLYPNAGSLSELERYPSNLIDRRTLELAPTGYYLARPIRSDLCQKVRWPELLQRFLL